MAEVQQWTVLSPQPAIETIDPVTVTEGMTTLTVTIKGFNFVRKSTVYFNGRSVPYKATSANEIQVTLDADLLRTPGRFDLLVKNPEPIGTDPLWGNGTSNAAYLIVNYKH
jgi:IPT/TIG domain